MERKLKMIERFCGFCIVAGLLLTLPHCKQNGGQAGYIPVDDIQYRQQLAEVIGILYKQWRKQRCLSAIIMKASDTKVCFDCHDKKER